MSNRSSICFSRSEYGSAALYVLVLIPIALALTAVAVDVSGWNALRETLQREVDHIAFTAAQSLPAEQEARLVVRELTRSIGMPGLESDVSFAGESNPAITVTLRAAYRPYLASLFGAGADAFKVERQGVAQLRPGDYVIVVANGASLRPGFEIPPAANPPVLATPWGTEQEWPASGYFNCALQPRIAKESQSGESWKWWESWEDQSFRRWATQSCFNPAFSALKLSAVSLVDELSQSPTNRISVMVTPGSPPPGTPATHTTLRYIHSERDNPLLYRNQIGGFFAAGGGAPEAHWQLTPDSRGFLGDDACLLFSDERTAFDTRYSLPPAPHVTRAVDQECTEPLDPLQSVCGQPHISFGHMRSCYAVRSIRLREAIYWQPAVTAESTGRTRPDLNATLRAAWAQLADPASEEQQQLERNLRGNLGAQPVKRIFVLADHLVSSESESAELTKTLLTLIEHDIETVFVLLEHEGQTAGAREELNYFLREIRDSEALAAADPARTVAVFLSGSADDVALKITPLLVQQEKRVALKS